MAFTNFTGPVRSDEGFEQLVDGVWTPVGSGGGGSVTQILTPYALGGSESEIFIPLPGITEATPGEIGQTFEVVIQPTTLPDASNNMFLITTEDGFSNALFVGSVIKTAGEAMDIPFDVLSDGVFTALQNTSGELQIVSGRIVITVTAPVNLFGTDFPAYTVSGQIAVHDLGG